MQGEKMEGCRQARGSCEHISETLCSLLVRKSRFTLVLEKENQAQCDRVPPRPGDPKSCL